MRGFSVWAQQPTVTLSGRVTDQNTAQGIADVAIVAQGNQTGTRVVITDVQGNYTLPFGANTSSCALIKPASYLIQHSSGSLLWVGQRSLAH